MAAYITLNKFTDQGIHSVKDMPKRVQAAKEAASAAGVRIIGIWWTLGQYDMVVISESSDEEKGMRFLLATGMQGNLRSETLRAFGEEEMERIVQGLP
jgi:uncharacterized protein with GYD domain